MRPWDGVEGGRWKSIPGFWDYAISDDGMVLNTKRNRLIPTRLNQQGVRMVTITNDEGLQKTKTVGLMVARAFLPPPPNDAYNSVIHLDGNKKNCHADNLAWRPRWFAIKYHKQFDEPPIDQAVYLTDTDEVFENIRDACKKYGLLEKQVYLDLWNQGGVWPQGWIFREYRE